jgi:hypothetical protein
MIRINISRDILLKEKEVQFEEKLFSINKQEDF